MVGEGVSPALVGTRVSVYHYRGRGVCRHCLAGEIVFCAGKRGYGWHVHGADADFLLTDARNCCPLPDELTHLDGSFQACAAGTAYAALRKLEAVPGAPTCAVVGLGPVGLARRCWRSPWAGRWSAWTAWPSGAPTPKCRALPPSQRPGMTAVRKRRYPGTLVVPQDRGPMRKESASALAGAPGGPSLRRATPGCRLWPHAARRPDG